MAPITCNACNKEFEDENDQKEHYRSEWHRYNLKRKVAGVPSVTETLFLARQAALAEEKSKSSSPQMLFSCSLCSKEYRSQKAHQNHLNSKSHLSKLSLDHSASDNNPVIKPFTPKQKQSTQENQEEEGEEEWVEVGEDEEMEMNGQDEDDEMLEMDELDPSICFMCDKKHEGIESCMVHMHKKHGFFIPDVEFLVDAEGLLIYVGLKVKRDYTCLYCNDRVQPFQSLEGVRKHMEAKGHCKLRFGDGGEDEDADLEDFYDYSSSYVDSEGKQLVLTDDVANTVELGSGGAELVITQTSEDGKFVKTLGSREFLRYYRQKPKPTPSRSSSLSLALASRYKNMGLATVQSKEQMVRMKIMKEMNRNGVQMMRTRMGMKSNVIRNLPKNCPY